MAPPAKADQIQPKIYPKSTQNDGGCAQNDEFEMLTQRADVGKHHLLGGSVRMPSEIHHF